MPKKIEPVNPRVLLRDWGAELIVAETPTYMGKVLTMNAGTAGGLQYHVEKDETFFLWEGRALVRSDDGYGQLNVTMMLPGQSFHIPAGAVHQVEAIEKCVFFETSTPHHNDRVRVEKQYGLPEGGGLPSTR
jgi:mannose-6-phosphate isomerase-like protein (cupin superfamily)